MILFNNFQAEPEDLISKEIEAATRVIKSGSYILGSELKNFERRWGHYCGINHAIGVANGMDAIEIGLRSLGIKAGDEVITTAMTAYATVLAIVRVGAIAVFADIDPNTGLMSIKSAMGCITKKTKAVLLVHLYGHMHDLTRWKFECSNRNIFLVEDCAQSHGAKWDGLSAGSFGEFGAYSFYPTKNLGALGDAGAIITASDAIEIKSRIILNYGQSERYHHPVQGVNSRLDEIQAAILVERLNFLESFIKRRQEIAGAYRGHFKTSLIENMSPADEFENHVYHLYVVKSPRRNELAEHLRANGIASLFHYPIPAHRQQANIVFRADPNGLRHTETHADVCLSIPCNPQMTNEEVGYVIDKINEFR